MRSWWSLGGGSSRSLMRSNSRWWSEDILCASSWGVAAASALAGRGPPRARGVHAAARRPRCRVECGGVGVCVCVCVRNSNSNSNRMNERATQDNHDPPRALERVCVNERATSSSRTNEEVGVVEAAAAAALQQSRI